MKITRAAPPKDAKAQIQAEAKEILQNHEWLFFLNKGLTTARIDHDQLADLVSDLVLAAYRAGRNEIVEATPRSAVGRILHLVK